MHSPVERDIMGSNPIRVANYDPRCTAGQRMKVAPRGDSDKSLACFSGRLALYQGEQKYYCQWTAPTRPKWDKTSLEEVGFWSILYGPQAQHMQLCRTGTMIKPW